MDKLLVERGFFGSRSQAAAVVLGGGVKVNGNMITKAGAAVSEDAQIELVAGPRFVSRGGLKLERAFEKFPINVEGFSVIDGGASTGGFTDCLLQHGAAAVFAVDVGYGQLDWKLRQDPRVKVLERMNIRNLSPEVLGMKADFAVLDLSFISLKKVIPAVIECLRPGFELVVLVKPQFEAGRGRVGKGGVVRERKVHRDVLRDIWDFAENAGCAVLGLTDSGVPGPKGNIEFLLYLADQRGHSAGGGPVSDQAIQDLLNGLYGRENPE